MALYLDDKPMTKKEVFAFLQIPTNFVPNTRKKIFEAVSKRIDDKGTVRPPKSIGGKPEYLIYVPHLEREVKVRYATSQRFDKDKNPVYPFPKTLTLMPAEDGTVAIMDELEYLFWFLRPMNLQSPFHNKNSAHFYSFKDDDARATANIDNEERYINAMSIIVGINAWEDLELKHLAKGMSVIGVEDMTPAVVKDKLKDLARKDPVKFYNMANSREVVFSGKIQEAIDQNILVLKSVNGMQRWYMKGAEILPIQYGQDPAVELKKFMAEKWYLYADPINDELQGLSIKSRLDNPINDAAFNEAKQSGVNIKAELTPQQLELLKEIKEKDWLEAKMEKIAQYDLTDPKLHPGKRQSYEANKEYFEAWKAAKNLEKESVS